MEEDERPGEREELAWSALLAAVLAVATVGLWLDGGSVGERAATSAIALGCAGWHAALTLAALQATDDRRRVRLGVVHAAGLVAFLLVLVSRSEDFFVLIYALYPQLFLRLGGWAVPAIAAATAGTFVLLDLRGGELVSAAAVSTALAVAIGFSIDAVDRLSRRRAATIAALEAARAEVLERGRTIGVLEERQRLARELHDTVAQGLVSVIAQLEAAEQELERGRPATGLERLARGREAARASLADGRRAMAALRPEVLDAGDGLGAGLRVLAGRLRSEDGLETAVDVRGDDRRLAPEAEDALLGCATEALSNVRRHAAARSVAITLEVGQDVAQLTVGDDGHGFDRMHAGDGYGLTTMAERAAAAGGAAEIASEPGTGTAVRVCVPVAGRSRAAVQA